MIVTATSKYTSLCCTVYAHVTASVTAIPKGDHKFQCHVLGDPVFSTVRVSLNSNMSSKSKAM